MKNALIISLVSGIIFVPFLWAASDNEKNNTLLAQTGSGGTGIKTDKGTPDLKKSRVFERRGRRDPFQPILTPKEKKGVTSINNDTNTQNTIKTTIKTPDEALVRLKEARQCLERMEQISRELPPSSDRDKALSEPYQKILEIYELLSKPNYGNIKAQIEEIRQEAEKLFPGAEKVYSQAKYLREQADQNFTKGEFTNLADNLKEISSLPERSEVKGTSYQTQIQAMVDEVKQLNQRAGIIKEFYSKNIAINGIIYYQQPEEITLPPLKMQFFGLMLSVPITYRRYVSASTVIINNSVYEEGAALEKELTIKKIESDNVSFLYKGEEVKKGLTKK